MAENARPPVAVRIVRPYDTEEAFLESELETVGKTSVILIGAHPRPQGVILRFEVTLQNGNVVLRGEGRVLQHKESAFRGQPGLALRFTRLDPKSKALVDRAGQIREARLSGSMPPQPMPVPMPEIPGPPPTPEPISSASPMPSSVELSSSELESDESSPNQLVSGRQIDTHDQHDTRPPTSPPPVSPSEPPDTATQKPPAFQDPSVPPSPLVSFVPLAIPSNIPISGPTGVPSAPPGIMTIAPDAVLATLLTAPTPPPPASTNVHATTTVAAPEVKEAPAPPPPEMKMETKANNAVPRVADRDALLARLRERRASMSDEKRDDILRSR